MFTIGCGQSLAKHWLAGAPKGKRNGNYRHGVNRRRALTSLIRELAKAHALDTAQAAQASRKERPVKTSVKWTAQARLPGGCARGRRSRPANR
jgi:hypothetical protein